MSAYRIAPLASTALIAGVLALSACAPKAPKTLPPEPGPARSSETTPMGPTPGSQADFLAFMMGGDVVYFDTDKSDLDSTATAALQKQAQWLLKYPNKHATIEGHCDERGTRDYNLALGERRANAAKNYLVSIGVEPGRLNTVSYGKERPVALGSDEASWAKNRRAVTVTID